MGSHVVEPGAVLADRYVIEDLLSEEGGSASWRAHDKILSRSVVLQVVPSSSPRAAEMLAAAKRASRVVDPRVLQVLDADDDGTLAYVVREWATGRSLDVVLAEGPLPARRSAWLVREVAASMANAHRMGIPHRRLAPDTVVLTKSSGIKVIGLATYAALVDEGTSDADPSEVTPDSTDSMATRAIPVIPDTTAGQGQDAEDLGRLLYACLTARWPGGTTATLPAAPTEHGRLLRPRQVRAGVPRPLDALCDRILSTSPRYGERLTSAAAIADALSELLADDRASGLAELAATPTLPGPAQDGPPPALLYRDDPPSGELPAQAEDSPVAPSSVRRVLLVLVVAILVVGVLLLAYLIGQRESDPSDPPPESPSSPAASAPNQLTPVSIVAAQDFDPPPQGSGDEHPELVDALYDGDLATAWRTETYYGSAEFGGTKDGVGVVLDVGQVQEVARVRITLTEGVPALELRAAPEDATQAPVAAADEYPLVAREGSVTSAAGGGDQVTFALDEPVQTRYLLVWLTRLPPVPDGFRASIAEVEVAG